MLLYSIRRSMCGGALFLIVKKVFPYPAELFGDVTRIGAVATSLQNQRNI
jgi:hypothetical protein